IWRSARKCQSLQICNDRARQIFWVVAGIDPGLEIREGIVAVAVAAGMSPAESKLSQPTRLPLQCAPAVHPNIPQTGTTDPGYSGLFGKISTRGVPRPKLACRTAGVVFLSYSKVA